MRGDVLGDAVVHLPRQPTPLVGHRRVPESGEQLGGVQAAERAGASRSASFSEPAHDRGGAAVDSADSRPVTTAMDRAGRVDREAEVPVARTRGFSSSQIACASSSLSSVTSQLLLGGPAHQGEQHAVALHVQDHRLGRAARRVTCSRMAPPMLVGSSPPFELGGEVVEVRDQHPGLAVRPRSRRPGRRVATKKLATRPSPSPVTSQVKTSSDLGRAEDGTEARTTRTNVGRSGRAAPRATPRNPRSSAVREGRARPGPPSNAAAR